MASVACDFLGSSFATTRDAVQGLIDSAAQTCGGNAYFYSAPGGRGRRSVVFDDRAQKNDGFVLVASKGSRQSDGEFASAEHACVMTLALETGVAWLGQLIAAAVYTSGILDGLLLIEMMPGTRPGTVSSAKCDTSDHERIRALASAVEWKGPAVLVPAMRLWAASLAERLEKMRLQEETTRLTSVLENVLLTLGHLLEPDPRLHETDACAAGMLRDHVFTSSSSKARFDLWACDYDTQQLIGNNSGRKDGNRVDTDYVFAGKAMSNNDLNNIYCTYGLPENGMDSKICIPLAQPVKSCQMQRRERAVLELTSTCSEDGTEGQEARIDHFELVGAELLQCSTFPTVLWVRDRFLQLIAIERKRDGIEKLVEKLEDTDEWSEAMDTLENQVGSVMGCEACTIFFVDNKQGEIWAPPNESRVGICVGIDDGLVGYVVTRAREDAMSGHSAVITNDPPSCELWSGDVGNGFVTRNILTAPVTSKGELKSVLAVIQLVNKFDNTASLPNKVPGYASAVGFTHSDAGLLEDLADAIGVFMQRHLLTVQWTKLRYDAAALASGSSCSPVDLDDIPSIAYEYYQLKREDEPTFVQPSKRATHMRLEASDMPEKHADIDLWGLYYWDLSQDEEYGLLVQILRKWGCMSELALSRPHLYRFFLGVRQSYNDVPYHNFYHALSTLHYAFKMIQSMETATESWTDIPVVSLYALTLAALAHDCGHRGRNNAFEITTRSDIAIRYNDSSPLENQHCATAFEIALNSSEDKCNVFQTLSTEDFESVRRHMVKWILATDMKHHATHVQDLQRCLETGHTAENHHVTMGTILHAADISNPMMPWEIADRWGVCVCEEFTQQANAERELGLPVTPFMANLTTTELMHKNHCGFIDFVIQPLSELLFKAVTGLDPLRENLRRNREAWSPGAAPAEPTPKESKPASRSEEDKLKSSNSHSAPAVGLCFSPSEDDHKPSLITPEQAKQREIRRSNFAVIPPKIVRSSLNNQKNSSMLQVGTSQRSSAGKELVPRSMSMPHD